MIINISEYDNHYHLILKNAKKNYLRVMVVMVLMIQRNNRTIIINDSGDMVERGGLEYNFMGKGAK